MEFLDFPLPWPPKIYIWRGKLQNRCQIRKQGILRAESNFRFKCGALCNSIILCLFQKQNITHAITPPPFKVEWRVANLKYLALDPDATEFSRDRRWYQIWYNLKQAHCIAKISGNKAITTENSYISLKNHLRETKLEIFWSVVRWQFIKRTSSQFKTFIPLSPWIMSKGAKVEIVDRRTRHKIMALKTGFASREMSNVSLLYGDSLVRHNNHLDRLRGAKF